MFKVYINLTGRLCGSSPAGRLLFNAEFGMRNAELKWYLPLANGNSQCAIRNSQSGTAKIELQREKRKERRAEGKRQKGSTKWGSWLRRSRRLKGCPSQGKASCINSIIYATFCKKKRAILRKQPLPPDAEVWSPSPTWGRLCGSSPSENACILP